MKAYNNGIALLLSGLLTGSFTQALTVNDPWGLFKFIMYGISILLTVIGFIRIIHSDEYKGLKTNVYIFSYILLYSSGITAVYIFLGGVISSLVSICAVIVTVKSNLITKPAQ